MIEPGKSVSPEDASADVCRSRCEVNRQLACDYASACLVWAHILERYTAEAAWPDANVAYRECAQALSLATSSAAWCGAYSARAMVLWLTGEAKGGNEARCHELAMEASGFTERAREAFHSAYEVYRRTISQPCVCDGSAVSP